MKLLHLRLDILPFVFEASLPPGTQVRWIKAEEADERSPSPASLSPETEVKDAARNDDEPREELRDADYEGAEVVEASDEKDEAKSYTPLFRSRIRSSGYRGLIRRLACHGTL